MANLIFIMISFISFPIGQLDHDIAHLTARSAHNENNWFPPTNLNRYFELGTIKESILTNGVRITFHDCRRASTGEILRFNLIIENLSTDTELTVSHASAFEREGDEFNGVKSGAFSKVKVKSGMETSFSIDILGVPPQTDYIRNLKFSVYSSNTEQETIAEFKNIAVVK